MHKAKGHNQRIEYFYNVSLRVLISSLIALSAATAKADSVNRPLPWAEQCARNGEMAAADQALQTQVSDLNEKVNQLRASLGSLQQEQQEQKLILGSNQEVVGRIVASTNEQSIRGIVKQLMSEEIK